MYYPWFECQNFAFFSPTIHVVLVISFRPNSQFYLVCTKTASHCNAWWWLRFQVSKIVTMKLRILAELVIFMTESTFCMKWNNKIWTLVLPVMSCQDQGINKSTRKNCFNPHVISRPWYLLKFKRWHFWLANWNVNVCIERSQDYYKYPLLGGSSWGSTKVVASVTKKITGNFILYDSKGTSTASNWHAPKCQFL